MTRLHRCGFFLGTLLAAGPVASAQVVRVEVNCEGQTEELGRALLRELVAIGVEPRLLSPNTPASSPLLRVRCTSSGEVELRFEDGPRVETVMLPSSDDPTSRALRVSEYGRSWLTLSEVEEGTESETPAGDGPDTTGAADAETEAETSEGTEPPDVEGSSEGATPESESEPTTADQDQPTDADAAPDSGLRPRSLGASLGLGSFFGQGDSTAAVTIAGEVAFRFRSRWRARAGVAAQVAGGGVQTIGDELETRLLRVSGDLSFLLAFGAERWRVALGVGGAALMVGAQGASNVLSMPPRDDSTWIPWAYALVGVSTAVHPRLRVYAEMRGGLIPSRVLSSSFSDPLPVLVGWVRFEASLGLEVAWPI